MDDGRARDELPAQDAVLAEHVGAAVPGAGEHEGAAAGNADGGDRLLVGLAPGDVAAAVEGPQRAVGRADDGEGAVGRQVHAGDLAVDPGGPEEFAFAVEEGDSVVLGVGRHGLAVVGALGEDHVVARRARPQEPAAVHHEIDVVIFRGGRDVRAVRGHVDKRYLTVCLPLPFRVQDLFRLHPLSSCVLSMVRP